MKYNYLLLGALCIGIALAVEVGAEIWKKNFKDFNDIQMILLT